MAEVLRSVNIGEYVISTAPDDVLVAYGLGSCVAVCLYDSAAGMGGMLHALLPTVPNGSRADILPAKYVDQGVPLLLETMLKRGADPAHVFAGLCGGAQMLSGTHFNDQLKMGQLNVAMAKKVLRTLGVRIRASSVGGCTGRTVKLRIADGRVVVRTLKEGERILIRGS